MKKTLVVLSLASFLFATSCNSGPHKLRKSWEDHVAQKYAEDSWIHGALLQDILPVYPLVGFVLSIADVVFLNTYTFWTSDVADRKGTVFVHDNPEAEKTVTGN